jgi:hypothetical protein
VFENRYDETMAEVSVVYCRDWNDDSKIRLFARFLKEETDPYLFQRFENFLQREAEQEIVFVKPKSSCRDGRCPVCDESTFGASIANDSCPNCGHIF